MDITSKLTSRPEMAIKETSAAMADHKIVPLHESLIDFLLANPAATKQEAARYMKKSVNWVSYLMSSQLFLKRLQERRSEIIDPSIALSNQERLEALTTATVDVLLKAILEEGNVAVASKTLESLVKIQVAQQQKPTTQVQNNYVVALPQKAPTAEAWAEKYNMPAGLAKLAEDAKVIKSEGDIDA